MFRSGRFMTSMCAGVLAITLLAVTDGFAAKPEPAFKPDEVIIKFRDGVPASRRQAVLANLGARHAKRFGRIKADHIHLTRGNVKHAIARYRNDPDIEFIEPNYILHADVVPNDPQFPGLWGLRNAGQTGGTVGADIHATQAWDVITGAPGVLVAIIDTGVDYTHPDLQANIFVNPGEIPGNAIDDDGNGFIDDVRGWDFAYDDSDPMDDNGHGSHVSGTIGAVGNNGIGVAGVNWQVRLLPIKFLDGSGSGTTEDAIDAIDYAARMGADVINASWGGGGYSEALRQSIIAADSAGTVFAAAAGNNGSDNDLFPHYPSNYDIPSLVSVAATDHNDLLAGFSNYGVNSVDLAGPGVDILSTFPGNAYGTISGTSMATPHVAGVLALIYARNPGITPLAAKNLLLNHVDPKASLAGRVLSGGRLNALLSIADRDTIPPGMVSDLSVTLTEGGRIELGWSATGDDGGSGTASRYDVRYATTPINAGNFAAATPAPGAPNPDIAGSPQSMSVGGLAFSTSYFVALRAYDEFDNPGPVSNVATATTLGPPEIDVQPASLSADLLTGETASRTLTLHNTGASELLFEVGVASVGQPSLSIDVITPDGAAPGSVLATGRSVPIANLGRPSHGLQKLPEGLATIDRTIAVEAAPSGSGRRVVSATEEIFGSSQFAFFGGPRTRGNIFECTTARRLREHRFYLDPEASTELWFLVYEGIAPTGDFHLISASNASPSGTGLGWYSSGPVDVELVEGRHYAIMASFVGAAGYFNQQGISPFPIPASFGSLTGPIGWNWAPEPQFPPPSSISLPPDVYGTPVAYYQTLITDNSVTWLSATPQSGRVPIGSTLQLSVTFDAAGLYGGDYDANLRITSNDPDEGEILVPAHLHVTGAPDIDVSPSAMAFGPLFLGGGRVDTLRIENDGTDLLHVSGINISPAVFSVPTAGIDLAPGERRALAVEFRPTAVGPVAGSLTVQSDDFDEGTIVVTLSGEGLLPPDIDVAPDSLSADLLTGAQTSRTITVRNTGLSNLTFTVKTEARAAAIPSMNLPALAMAPARPWQGVQVGSVGVPGIDRVTGPLVSSPPGGRNPVTGTNEVLVLTTATINGSVLRALDELGRGYDILFGDDFTAIDFTQYTTILVALDGGYVTENSCAALANAAASGRLVFIIGGTNWGTYYNGLQTYLIGHTGQTGWSTSPPPHLRITNPSDPLAAGLPATVNYSVFEASYHMLRISDPAAHVAAVNSVGSGDPALVHKAIGAGTLVYYVNPPDDILWTNPTDYAVFKRIIENGLGYASVPWLRTTPDNGSVAPGQSMTIEVTFDAAGLFGGDYEALVQIDSNDPDESRTAVPAHLHVTGAPDISLSRSAIDFGSLFVGAARSESLEVRNAGTDLLNVSGITVSDAQYEVVTDGFALAPRASRMLMITYRPTVAVPTAATLTVHSDDADEAEAVVALAGVGLVPPDIGVSPDSLSADLLTGQQASRTLTISNTGGSDLTFTLGINSPQPSLNSAQVTIGKGDADLRRGAPVTQSSGGPDQFGYRWIDSDDPGGPAFDWVEIAAVGTAVPYSGDDWNYGPIPIGFDVSFYGNTYSSFQVCSNGWISFTSGSAQFVNYPLPSPYAPENMMAVMWADLSTNPGAVLYHNDGSRMIIEYRDVTYLGGGAPFTFQIQLYPNGRIVYQYLNMGGTPTYGAVGIQNATQNDGLTVAYNALYLHDGLAVQFAAVPPWLSVTPTSGTIPAGGTLDLDVQFDATGMLGGDYDDHLQISSNDPDESLIAVPLHLHVTGAPDIDVVPLAIDFQSLYIGAARTESLVVHNAGTDLLSVSGVVLSSTEYEIDDDGPFSLAPGDRRTLRVTFRPTTAVLSPATLTVNSNDADELAVVVALSGTGVLPPDIDVSPDSLSADLLTGGQALRSITIRNTGLSSLAFTLSTHGLAALQAVGSAPTLAPAPRPWSGTQVGSVGVPGITAAVAPLAAPAMLRGAEGTTSSPDVLVLTTATITSSVLRALDELGRGYDFRFGDDFTGIDFTPYSAIVVALDGGLVNEASCAALASAAASGRLVFMMGGTNWGPYYNGLQTYLVRHSGLTGWVTSPPPHLLVAEALDPLANGLPATVTFNVIDASYYMLRILDPAATVAAINGIGSPALMHKSIGAGTLVYYVNPPDDVLWGNPADYAILKHIVENALGYADVPWLSVSPDNGALEPGQSMTVQVAFDATGLYGGSYEGLVQIDSNDPDESRVTVPAQLHVTGAPDIALSPSAIDFGSLFVGAARSESLEVRNAGTDLLTVTGITVSNTQYEVDVTSGFALAPGATRGLRVTFHPTAAAPSAATLTVHSDDADEAEATVALSGVGLVPPDIGVSPDSLSADLLTGQQTSRTLTISNSGGSDLTFSLGLIGPQPSLNYPQVTIAKGNVDLRRGAPVTDGRGGPDPFGYRWIDSDEPGGPVFDWVEIAGIGTPVPYSGDDWNYGPIPLGFTFDFYGNEYSSIQVCSNGWISFTSGSAQFVNYPLPSPFAPENMMAAMWADLFTNPGAVLYHNDGTRMIVEYRNVSYLGGGAPFTFQIQLYPNGRIVYQYLDVGGTPTYGAVGIQNAGRDIGLTVAYNAPYLHSALAIQFAALPPWLSVTPTAGTIPAGGHVDLDVRFDASGLMVGSYESEVLITTNDPDESSVRVPTRLNVVELPDIDALPVDFGPRYVGQPVTLPVTLLNVGLLPLQISSMTLSGPGFTFAPAPALPVSIPGQGSLAVPVRFAPAGPCSPCVGDLSVISNDPDEGVFHVALTGTGILPPQIEIQPVTLHATLAPQLGDMADDETQTLIVSNHGGSDLEVALGRRAAPVAAAVTGTDRPVTQAGGGPDIFGYSWIDSDSPGGPVFQWIDIAAPAYRLPLTGNDRMYQGVPIGFSFPFYGRNYETLNVSTNGFLSFTDVYPSPNNMPLPKDSTNVPTNLLAPFWDNLNFGTTQCTYARHTADQFVLSWVGVNSASTGGGTFTFQVILEASGRITYQYLSMAGIVNRATVGIQNLERDDGLTVAFDENYLHDGLATRFQLGPSWLSVDPSNFIVPPGGTRNVAVHFDARGLANGDYAGEIKVQSNDLETPAVIVPVGLHVGSLDVTLDLDPNTLNRNSHGRWVNGTITLPPSYDPHQIDISSVLVQSSVPVDSSGPVTYSGQSLHCKFDRQSIFDVVPEGEHVPVIVTGRLVDDTWFAGLDVVRMIRPHVGTPPSATYSAGSQVDLAWSDGGPAVMHYDLWFSANDGDSWSLVAGGITERHIVWHVPLAATNNGVLELVAVDAAGVMGSWMSNTIRILPVAAGTEVALPLQLALKHVGANPAQGRAVLELSVPKRSEMSVTVFDIRGARVRSLAQRVFEPGWHRLEWDGLRDDGGIAGTGVYFVRADCGGRVLSTRVAMLR